MSVKYYEKKSLVVTTDKDVVDAYDGVISLREAILYANNGTRAEDGTATITFDDSLGDSINIAWDTTLGHIELTSGIYADETLTIDGQDKVTVTGGEASDGVFLIRSNNNITIKNMDFTGHDNGTIIFNQGTLLAENCSISNSTTGYCAGIWTQDGNTTIKNCQFSNNSVTRNSAAVRNERGTVTIEDCYFYNNHADGYGGAIHNVFSPATMSIKNTVFESNSSDNGGGAIYNFNDATVSLDGCTFIDNSATYGLSLWNGGGSSSTTVNSEFYGNNTDAVLSFTVSDENVSVDGNILSATWNDPENVSHVIKIDDEIIEVDTPSYSGKLTAGEHEIYVGHKDSSNNYAWGKKNAVSTISSVINEHINIVSGSTYTILPSYIYSLSSQYEKGGAVHNEGTVTGTEEPQTRTVFKNNRGVYGGAVYNKGSMMLSHIDFSNNTAQTVSYGYDGGGALYNDGYPAETANMTLTDCNFTENTADEGGAIFNRHATLSVTGGTFSKNKAHGISGAIENYGGYVFLEDAIFTENISNSSGGVIFNYSNDLSLEVTDGSFTGNQAKYDGGAVYNRGGMKTVGSTFSDNIAGSDGGAINNDGDAELINVTFSNNQAQKGGAIYNNDSIILTDVTFFGNTAEYGGAIYNSKNYAHVEDEVYSHDRIKTVTIQGTVTLATDTDTIYNEGVLNWNLAYGKAYLNDYALVTNAGELCITTATDQKETAYLLAENAINFNDTFSLLSVC